MGQKYRVNIIYQDKKAVDWIKRKATTFLQEHSLAVNVQERNINKKNFLCVRFMEDDYGSNVHVGLEKSVRFMECPFQSVRFGEVLL